MSAEAYRQPRVVEDPSIKRAPAAEVSPQELGEVRQQLASIVKELRSQYPDIKGISFGSSVLEKPETKKLVRRDVHDVDCWMRLSTEEEARRAAEDFKSILETRGVTDAILEEVDTYGLCMRLAYTASIDGQQIPVEVFFENEEKHAGLGAKKFSRKSSDDTELERISRAQHIRTLLVVMLQEADARKQSGEPQLYLVGGQEDRRQDARGEKDAQRRGDLFDLMLEHTPRALLKLKNKGKLYDWLSGGNPAIETLIQKHEKMLNGLLNRLRDATEREAEKESLAA